MSNLLFKNLDRYFKEKNMDEAAQAKFLLCPDETDYCLWNIENFKQMYREKEIINDETGSENI